MKMKPLARFYTVLVMVFLFAPIAILLVFSFNQSKSLSVFSGFSLYWYRELFRDSNTLGAVRNTLLLAVSASLISTAMGTAAAVGIFKLRNKYLRTLMDSVTNIPMINPDIITGISLMLMFVFIGRLFGAATSLSFWTMLIAHVTFCLPYVILQVLPKLQQMDKSLPEAAQDLGCTPLRAFFKVEIPEILPGVITGLIMAFTLSLDDFVISYFTAGNGFQTLPAGEYLCYEGAPVFAAFHSSSAGATEASAAIWNPRPYLVSVPSPESAETVRKARRKRKETRKEATK